MGNKLIPVNATKKDAFTLIQKYMAGEIGADMMTADAEQMLTRLMFADGLFRQKKPTADVCKALQNNYAISEHTAMRDIKNTQRLFAVVRSINKTYLTHLQLERLDADIEMIRERLYWYEKDEQPGVKFARVPDAKEIHALAQMQKVYSYTLEAAPDEKKKDVLPPPVFNFILVKGAKIETDMTAADALAAADAFLKAPQNPADALAGEYLDFQETDQDDETGDDDQDDE